LLCASLDGWSGHGRRASRLSDCSRLPFLGPIPAEFQAGDAGEFEQLESFLANDDGNRVPAGRHGDSIGLLDANRTSVCKSYHERLKGNSIVELADLIDGHVQTCANGTITLLRQ
jgi:hypothetical protein